METLRAMRCSSERWALKSMCNDNITKHTESTMPQLSTRKQKWFVSNDKNKHYSIKLWFFTWSDQVRAESIPWRSKICRLYASLFCSLQIYQHKKSQSEKFISKSSTCERSCLENVSIRGFPASLTMPHCYELVIKQTSFEIFVNLDQVGKKKFWTLIQTLEQHHYRPAAQARGCMTITAGLLPSDTQLVNKQLFKCYAKRDL